MRWELEAPSTTKRVIRESFTLTGQLDTINLDIYILKCGISVSNVGTPILYYIHNLHVYFCKINSGSSFLELQSISLHIQCTLLIGLLLFTVIFASFSSCCRCLPVFPQSFWLSPALVSGEM